MPRIIGLSSFMRRRWAKIKSECMSLLTEKEKALAESARKEIRSGYILVYDSSRAKKRQERIHANERDIKSAMWHKNPEERLLVPVIGSGFEVQRDFL